MFRLSHRRSAIIAFGRKATSVFVRNESGATAVSFALLSSIALGFAGLAIDLGTAYQARRHLQNAADSAAFSAATMLVSTQAAQSEVTNQARAVTARYGVVSGSDGTLVEVSQPPTSGPYMGLPKAVEVLITRPGQRFFSSLFASGSTMIRSRAVAKVNAGVDACVVALNGNVSISSATAELQGCSLYSNSSGSNAFEMSGTSSFTGSGVSVVGGSVIGSNSTISTQYGVRTGQQPIQDPYRDVPVPPYSGCTHNAASLPSGTYGGSYSSPVVFCNGLTLNSGVTVTLNPGIYIIDRGELLVNGGATLQGSGVTIILTSSSGSNYATATFNGQSTINLSAPTEGPTAGILLYQDRRAPTGVENRLNGGTTQRLQGALYFPRQIVRYAGGSSSTTNGCTQLIAGEIILRGQSNFQMNCSGTGVKRAGGPAVTLVE